MLFSYLSFLCFLEGLAVAVIPLVLDRKAALNRAVALEGVLYSIWAFCMIFVYGSDDGPTRMLFYRLSYLGVLFIGPAMFLTCLVLARVSLWLRVGLVLWSFFWAGMTGLLYLNQGFYYAEFRPGPWGNVGVVADPTEASRLWFLLISLLLAVNQVLALVLMWRRRARLSSRKQRAQITVLTIHLLLLYLLYFLVWWLEERYALPPLEVFLGGYIVAVYAFLVAKYRYLRLDGPLMHQDILRALDEAVLVVDPQWRIQLVNPAAQRLFSDSLPLEGREILSLVENTRTRKGGPELVASGQASWELTGELANGETAALSLRPCRDSFDDVTGAIAVVRPQEVQPGLGSGFGLTLRERHIALMLTQGCRIKEISEAAQISPGTVRTHIHSMYQKTGAANRVDLVRKLLGERAAP